MRIARILINPDGTATKLPGRIEVESAYGLSNRLRSLAKLKKIGAVKFDRISTYEKRAKIIYDALKKTGAWVQPELLIYGSPTGQVIFVKV